MQRRGLRGPPYRGFGRESLLRRQNLLEFRDVHIIIGSSAEIISLDKSEPVDHDITRQNKNSHRHNDGDYSEYESLVHYLNIWVMRTPRLFHNLLRLNEINGQLLNGRLCRLLLRLPLGLYLLLLVCKCLDVRLREDLS